jgi:hypothetical protein
MPDTPETIAVPLFASLQAAILPTVAPEVATAPSETHEPDAPADSSQGSQPAPPPMSLKDAVLNCRKAWKQAIAAEKARGAADYPAEKAGAQAYCASMPLLTSEGNIRAFIACVAHAMAIDIMRKSEGLQLICVARAALIGLPHGLRSPAGPPKNSSIH